MKNANCEVLWKRFIVKKKSFKCVVQSNFSGDFLVSCENAQYEYNKKYR